MYVSCVSSTDRSIGRYSTLQPDVIYFFPDAIDYTTLAGALDTLFFY